MWRAAAGVRKGALETLAVLALTLALGGLLPGCDVPRQHPRLSPPTIRVTPADGSDRVLSHGPLKVSVSEGRLVRVRVRMTGRGGARGRTVPGGFTRGARVWRPVAGSRHGLAAGERSVPLVPGSSYAVDAVALDGEGRHLERHTTFRTKKPAHRLIGYFTPEHRQTVGTGMIVSLSFNRPVADRPAVERAISVSTRPSVRVAPHWFGSSRLDFRPRRFWRPGTRVTLSLRLSGVRAAPGVYGVQRKRVTFTIGRDQRSVVDAATHMMTVRRGGRVVRQVPVTAGAASTPTYSGHMVISEKAEQTRMDAATVGFGGQYDIADVPHAMRLTGSGTFLHGNYWTPQRTFGSANVSHGCVGLRDVKGGGGQTPAGAFFDSSLVGDVVTVEHSGERTVAAGNGLSGWNMGWGQWKAGSARR
jgi:lipoprotein-anchoring transpeptidase ErfK/SrfK